VKPGWMKLPTAQDGPSSRQRTTAAHTGQTGQAGNERLRGF
jgi:hypothetical protein